MKTAAAPIAIHATTPQNSLIARDRIS